MGIALSVALAAGIAPATAIAAETSSPVDAVVLQTAASSETAATEKEKAYAAMQEALKNLEAAKKKIARCKSAADTTLFKCGEKISAERAVKKSFFGYGQNFD